MSDIDTGSPTWRAVLAHIADAKRTDIETLTFNGTPMETSQFLRGRLAAWSEIEDLPQPSPPCHQPLR